MQKQTLRITPNHVRPCPVMPGHAGSCPVGARPGSCRAHIRLEILGICENREIIFFRLLFWSSGDWLKRQPVEIGDGDLLMVWKPLFAYVALLVSVLCCVTVCGVSSAGAGAAPVARIGNLDDLLSWVDHSFSFAAWATKTPLSDLRSLLERRVSPSEGFSMSTAFSGIGSPEHAMGSILRHLGSGSVKHLYGIEIFQESRRELFCLPTPHGCLFDDVNRFWNVDHDVDDTWSCDELTQLIRGGDAVVTGPGGGWCCTHQSTTCCLKPASLHIGGTPCPDWSTQGVREGEFGDDLLATLAWVAMRYQLEDDLWLNENVSLFPVEIILAALFSKYLIMTCIVKVEQFWAARRHRRLTFGVLKTKFVVKVQWDRFCSSYRRKGAATWADFCIADGSELASELRWARRRKKSLYRKRDEHLQALAVNDPRCQADPEVLDRILELKHKSDFTDALTWWELHNIDKYLEFLEHEVPFEVGQAADDWPMYGTAKILPCLIAGMQMCFSALHWRWLTPKEVLLAQGFCVMANQKHIFGKTCFHNERPVYRRKRHILFQQAGDNMPQPMIGHAICWALSCVERRSLSSSPPLGKRYRLRGKRSVSCASSELELLGAQPVQAVEAVPPVLRPFGSEQIAACAECATSAISATSPVANFFALAAGLPSGGPSAPPQPQKRCKTR